MKVFDDIATYAKHFVAQKKGQWDHAGWEDFLRDMQDKGIAMSEETSNLIGTMLESLKKLYFMNPKDIKLFNEITTYAKSFVKKQKGEWDHSMWENFLVDVYKKDVSITEELTNALGGILESFKNIYTISPKSEKLKTPQKRKTNDIYLKEVTKKDI